MNERSIKNALRPERRFWGIHTIQILIPDTPQRHMTMAINKTLVSRYRSNSQLAAPPSPEDVLDCAVAPP